MTTTTTGAPSTGASGRSSSKKATTNGKGKHVAWHDLDLLLPPDPPGDLAFSIEENEVSGSVREIFGETQYVQIREQCKAEKLNLNQTYEALAELLRLCFEQWGLTTGES